MLYFSFWNRNFFGTVENVTIVASFFLYSQLVLQLLAHMLQEPFTADYINITKKNNFLETWNIVLLYLENVEHFVQMAEKVELVNIHSRLHIWSVQLLEIWPQSHWKAHFWIWAWMFTPSLGRNFMKRKCFSSWSNHVFSHGFQNRSLHRNVFWANTSCSSLNIFIVHDWISEQTSIRFSFTVFNSVLLL